MLRVNYKHKMGEVTIVQKSNGQKFTLYIYAANAICAFINEYKNEEGETMAQLISFFADSQHVRNLIKNKVDLFENDIVKKVSLNMWYEDNKYVLNYFIRLGYKVTCYYKEDKR